MTDTILFTYEQGNLLIRLLLAHIVGDFILQSNSMIQNKKCFSKYMAFHIIIVFLSTYLLIFSLKISLLVTFAHWLIDSIKQQVQSKFKNFNILISIVHQLFHFLSILAMWVFYFDLFDSSLKALSLPFINYKFSLILFAYLFVYFPSGSLIKLATQSISHSNANDKNQKTNEEELQHGGKLIGQFERVIILTLVLLNQFEAIGFLITGKSIIRFADHNSNLRSEYVLVGTMLSYAIAILTGTAVNYLLSI